MDKFSTPQFSKTISNTNDTRDDYQRILDPYPYDALLEFHWFPNGWKLEPIESTPTNISFEQLFLDKVKPTQEKQKKNQMKLDLWAKVENPNILLYVQLHPQGILPFWYWKTRSFPLSDIRKAKCPEDKVAVYMYIYVYTQIYNLCNLFMSALQYDLRLVTVQWCNFLFRLLLKNLCWRN